MIAALSQHTRAGVTALRTHLILTIPGPTTMIGMYIYMYICRTAAGQAHNYPSAHKAMSSTPSPRSYTWKLVMCRKVSWQPPGENGGYSCRERQNWTASPVVGKSWLISELFFPNYKLHSIVRFIYICFVNCYLNLNCVCVTLSDPLCR